MNITKKQQSRKVYNCEQCGIDIPKNVLYVRHQWKSDGTILFQTMHTECNRKWVDINDPNDNEWFPISDILEPAQFNEHREAIYGKYSKLL